MPTLGQIKLPSGNVYDLADNYARQLLAGGLVFEICWNGQSTPVVANIPAGVKVKYNDVEYTGTKAASTAEPLHFYLVYSPTQEGENDAYDEYAAMRSGAGTTQDPYVYTWEKIGDTRLDLSDLGALAYKDNVTLNKQTATVLGTSATFSAEAQASSVSFSGGTDDKVLGADTTFNVTQPTITVTPTTTNIKATPSGISVGSTGSASAVTGYASPSSDTFVKSVSASTSKMVQTTVPNVTSAGSASTFSFAMGDGVTDPADCLVISGSNSVAPTLGTAITVATGALDANGAGASVATGASAGSTGSALTGLGTPTTASVVTGVEVTSQGSVALATGATAGTGVVSVATGITSATATNGAVSANTNDQVTAVTGVGTATAAAQSVSVSINSNDSKTVLTDSTSVSVS